MYTQVIRHEGVAVDWKDLRHGRRLEKHRQDNLKNRWQALNKIVKDADITKMPLAPDAREAYNRFMCIDVTAE